MPQLEGHYDAVKVFSATKAKEREQLGETITEWIHGAGANYDILHTVVTQSSDSAFHCFTITLFLHVSNP